MHDLVKILFHLFRCGSILSEETMLLKVVHFHYSLSTKRLLTISSGFEMGNTDNPVNLQGDREHFKEQFTTNLATQHQHNHLNYKY